MQSSVSSTALGKTDGETAPSLGVRASSDGVGCFEPSDGDAKLREIISRSSNTWMFRVSYKSEHLRVYIAYVKRIFSAKE